MDAEELRQAEGRRIKAAREARHMTQAQLAAAAGIGSANTIGNMENGRDTKPKKLGAVLDFLGIEPASETMKRIEYPEDVEHVREVIGMYTLAKPPAERRRISEELTLWMMEREAKADMRTEG